MHIIGDKIKIAGDHPDNGVYFVSVDEPENRLKMTRIAENSAGRIIGIAPDVRFRFCRIEIRTQYAGGGSNLKEPKLITGDFTVEAL